MSDVIPNDNCGVGGCAQASVLKEDSVGDVAKEGVIQEGGSVTGCSPGLLNACPYHFLVKEGDPLDTGDSLGLVSFGVCSSSFPAPSYRESEKGIVAD